MIVCCLWFVSRIVALSGFPRKTGAGCYAQVWLMPENVLEKPPADTPPAVLTNNQK